MEDVILKLKVKSLIELRTSIINALIILTGGTAGLFFLPDSTPKNFFIIAGVFYIVTFISNIKNINNKIAKLLNNGKEKYE